MACDTILNLLLKKDEVELKLDESAFVDLLKALVYWSGTIQYIQYVDWLNKFLLDMWPFLEKFNYSRRDFISRHVLCDSSSQIICLCGFDHGLLIGMSSYRAFHLLLLLIEDGI
ncbi:hypothetical protein QL285_004257 [Trifolium repens]|nr:hypothetical protein QL285_004257 [Trifolium repens]